MRTRYITRDERYEWAESREQIACELRTTHTQAVVCNNRGVGILRIPARGFDHTTSREVIKVDLDTSIELEELLPVAQIAFLFMHPPVVCNRYNIDSLRGELRLEG